MSPRGQSKPHGEASTHGICDCLDGLPFPHSVETDQVTESPLTHQPGLIVGQLLLRSDHGVAAVQDRCVSKQYVMFPPYPYPLLRQISPSI